MESVVKSSVSQSVISCVNAKPLPVAPVAPVAPVVESAPVEAVYKATPFNVMLNELKSKLEANTNQLNECKKLKVSNTISGSSSVHIIPAYCGGVITIPIDMETTPRCSYSLNLTDLHGGINSYVYSITNKCLSVFVENMLDIQRRVRIEYVISPL